MNIITLTGRVAKKGELKDAKNGNKYLQLTIASKTLDKTNFFRCTTFGHNAVFVDKYVVIGDSVAASGSVTQKEDDPDKFSIAVDRFEKLYPKKETETETKPKLQQEDDALPF